MAEDPLGISRQGHLYTEPQSQFVSHKLQICFADFPYLFCSMNLEVSGMDSFEICLHVELRWIYMSIWFKVSHQCTWISPKACKTSAFTPLTGSSSAMFTRSEAGAEGLDGRSRLSASSSPFEVPTNGEVVHHVEGLAGDIEVLFHLAAGRPGDACFKELVREYL